MKVKLITIGAATVLATSGVVATASSASADDVYGHCTASGVRIRAAANTSSTILGLCYPSHQLAHRDVSADGNWDKVIDTTTGITGWMSHQYWAWD